MVIYGKYTDTSSIYIQLILYLAIQEVSDSMLLMKSPIIHFICIFCMY